MSVGVGFLAGANGLESSFCADCAERLVAGGKIGQPDFRWVSDPLSADFFQCQACGTRRWRTRRQAVARE